MQFRLLLLLAVAVLVIVITCNNCILLSITVVVIIITPLAPRFLWYPVILEIPEAPEMSCEKKQMMSAANI